jgi:glycosyltransferase involved in cell wall biosynthesis
MQEFYDSIDLLICTSSTEGGPLGVFEAIACGVPVISTNVGLVKEVDSIHKFDTAQQACELIERLKSQELLKKYRSNQYCQLYSEFCTEQLFGYWEDLFVACDCLNSKTLLF